jgi:peptidoglycan/xylan/chitin deacetylase (PgdA/CDA1 family)
MYNESISHGLMFHRFHDPGQKIKGFGSLTGQEFDDILNIVGIDRIISPEEWMLKVETNTLHPKDLCITFDDGLKSQYKIAAPILDKYNLKAFWFIFSSVFNKNIEYNEIYNLFTASFYSSFSDFFQDFIEKSYIDRKVFNTSKYLSYHNKVKLSIPFYLEDEIKYRFVRDIILDVSAWKNIMHSLISSKGLNINEMSKGVWMEDNDLRSLDGSGHCIGLHSYNHVRISDLEKERQISEYVSNYDHIKGVVKGSIKCMSHPLNSYSDDTLRILENMNIVCGFRASMYMEPSTNNNLTLPREDSTVLKKLL